MKGDSALVSLAEALQGFINEDEGEAAVIVGAVLVYEVTRFEDDGAQTHRINYTIPAVQTSMATAVGLLDAGLHMVRRAATSDPDE